MSPEDDPRARQQKLQREVEKQVARIRKAEKERRTLLGQSVYLGTVGLMFVLPVIAGAYLGKWLDELSNGYHVEWTVSMIFLGVAVGAMNVYLFVREQNGG